MATLSECARHIALSERRFRELVDAGRYSARGTRRLRSRRHAPRLHRTPSQGSVRRTPTSGGEETRRLKSARAEMAELQLARQRGEMAPLADVNDAFDTILVIARNRLLGLPAKAAPRVIAMRTPADAFEYLDTEVRDILENMAAMGARDIAKIMRKENARKRV